MKFNHSNPQPGHCGQPLKGRLLFLKLRKLSRQKNCQTSAATTDQAWGKPRRLRANRL